MRNKRISTGNFRMCHKVEDCCLCHIFTLLFQHTLCMDNVAYSVTTNMLLLYYIGVYCLIDSLVPDLQVQTAKLSWSFNTRPS